MIRVLKIEVEPGVPVLTLEPESARRCGQFDGTAKAELFGREELLASAQEFPAYPRQFLAMAPGVLVLPEAAWLDADEMYYCCSLGNELLAVKADVGDFAAINPLEVLPTPVDGEAPCVVDKFYSPVFRIAGRDPRQLFCVEGLGTDDFKGFYDALRFRGLVFQEIWRG